MATAKEKAAPMNRGDVAGAIAAKHGLPLSQADAMTREYEAAIVRALVSGQEVRLNGFGSFKIAQRSARMARNPQTGEMKQVPAKTVPKFQPSKTMKDAIAATTGGNASKAAKAPAKAAASKAPSKVVVDDVAYVPDAAPKAAAAKAAAPKAAAKAPAKAAAAKGGKKK